MTPFENPALKEFLAQIGNELTLAQVIIRRAGSGYELRHAADAGTPAQTLHAIKLEDARNLAQYTAASEFRPLKSAPTLERGWRLELTSDAELETALNLLFPGAVADWFAGRSPNPPITGYREFTDRQSGMYRVTAMLTNAQAAEVIRACCAPDCCLKRRLWSVTGLEADGESGKSIIPCLEPCAVLLEAARKAFRAAQEKTGAAASELADGIAMD